MIETLKTWRKAHGVSQQKLAAQLNVSQAAVSRWEAGVDTPSLELLGRIKALLEPATQHAISLEQLFIREQYALHVLFDLDGARLLAASRGYSAIFPRFSRLIGERFADHMVGETRVIFEDRHLHTSIKLGEIALMTGTTERHINHRYDQAIRHHWTICFRKVGNRVLGDVAFELCKADAETKLDKIVRMDEL